MTNLRINYYLIALLFDGQYFPITLNNLTLQM